MDTKRQRKRIALLACAIVWTSVLCVSGCTQTPAPIRQHAPKPPSVAAKAATPARRLALERYAFMQRLEPIFGFVPPKYTEYVNCDVLFPVGRSDRVYLLFEDKYASSPTNKAIVCYQHIGGQDRLVYQVNLMVKDRAVKLDMLVNKGKHIPSLLDYLNVDGLVSGENDKRGNLHFDAIKGQISPLASKDLVRKQDYVHYFYNPFSSKLYIWRLSNLFVYENSTIDFREQNYYVDEDPVTKAKITSDEFFAKYGLPVAKGELAGK